MKTGTIDYLKFSLIIKRFSFILEFGIYIVFVTLVFKIWFIANKIVLFDFVLESRSN